MDTRAYELYRVLCGWVINTIITNRHGGNTNGYSNVGAVVWLSSVMGCVAVVLCCGFSFDCVCAVLC
jgi:hypothetical protein